MWLLTLATNFRIRLQRRNEESHKQWDGRILQQPLSNFSRSRSPDLMIGGHRTDENQREQAAQPNSNKVRVNIVMVEALNKVLSRQ